MYRIKNLFQEIDVRDHADEILLSLTRKRGLIPYSEASKRLSSSDNFLKYKFCHPGDLVMNRMQAWSGMFAIANLYGLVSPDYSVFKLINPNNNSNYFLYLIKTSLYIDQFAKNSKGIGSGFNRLYTPEFGAINCIVPPLEEQNAIVRFLDYIDRRIKRYIRAKQKLIKLLEEEKQAIIHQAVTRGLNPDVLLKPSGVERLGNIPSHWETIKLKNVTYIKFSNVNKHILENEFPVRLCNYVDVYKNDRITDYIQFMKASATKEEIKQNKIEIDDVVITKDSEMWNDIGVPSLIKYSAPDLICGYHLAILRPNKEKIHGNYLFYCLLTKTIALQFHMNANGITRYGLSQNSIKNVIIPLPPTEEQKAIFEFINEKIELISTKVKLISNEIDLIKEYHTRLIADVVTGKLDVRAAASQLPEELEEIEVEAEEEVPEDVEETLDEEMEP